MIGKVKSIFQFQTSGLVSKTVEKVESIETKIQ